MKKIVLLMSVCLFMGACSSTSSQQTSSFVIGGSTSVQPLMEQLSEKYNEKGDANLTVQGGGSSVGIKGTIAGTFDAGMSSRELKASEKESLDEKVIAIDGIIIVVNKNNGVKDLNLKQIKAIYTGEITNWSQVGGDNLKIAIVSREEGSGTRDGFESIVGFASNDLISTAEIQSTTGAVISNVSGNKNAIGYISMGSMSDEVSTLLVNGVAPSEETITNKTYLIQRPFIVCFKKGTNELKDFFDFVYSQEGRTIILKHKYVPVTPNE